MTECPLTELPPEQCACRNHRGGEVITPDDEIVTVGQPFEAMYGGQCAAGCDRGIRVGDEIARVADQPGVYTHARGCGREGS